MVHHAWAGMWRQFGEGDSPHSCIGGCLRARGANRIGDFLFFVVVVLHLLIGFCFLLDAE